jgi:hypothetical protein
MNFNNVARKMIEAVPDNTPITQVLASCGWLAATILRDIPESRRREWVERFVDTIYETTLELVREE